MGCRTNKIMFMSHDIYHHDRLNFDNKLGTKNNKRRCVTYWIAAKSPTQNRRQDKRTLNFQQKK